MDKNTEFKSQKQTAVTTTSEFLRIVTLLHILRNNQEQNPISNDKELFFDKPPNLM